jgi:hypothetical protein
MLPGCAPGARDFTRARTSVRSSTRTGTRPCPRSHCRPGALTARARPEGRPGQRAADLPATENGRLLPPARESTRHRSRPPC